MKNIGHRRKNRKQILKCRFLCLTLAIFFSGNLLAQENRINISLNNTTVEVVLNEIRNQSDVNIIYNHEELKACPKISVNIKNLTVEDALKQCLKDTKLEFEKVKNTYVIKPKAVSTSNKDAEVEIETQTIRGRVIDRESKVSLPYANILVLNTNPQKGVTTDSEGYFKIENLPVGRYSLQISFIGYEKAVLSELLLGSAKELVINIELTESSQNIKEVIISEKKGQPLNEMATVSSKSFSVEETKRYAASISDPGRMAQAFAGVATSDDSSNEIVIRGNSPNWMLWRLEGVEIPNPNHFAEEGFTAGNISILSSNMLGKSDFFTGAFPAEYGSALSGVFDLRLRNGNNETREYSAQIGLLGIELAAEGPFKKGYKGSYLINYRYSTLSVLNNLGIEVSENALPNYQDLSFKIFLPTKKAGIFSVWGIGGVSDSREKYEPDTTLNEKFEYGYIDNTITGMYASGIGHTLFLDNKSYIKSVISYSKSFSNNQFSRMDSLGEFFNNYNDEFGSGAIRFNSFYNRKISNKLSIRLGGNLSRLNFNYFSELLDDSKSWRTNIKGSGNTNMYQAFFHSKYKITDKVVVNGGIHYTHFALSSDNSIEPRVGIQVDLKKNQKLGFGFGMHSKSESLPVYFVEFKNPNNSVSYLNKNLKLTRSTHYILSYERLIKQSLSFKTELYYQSISNLPVPNNPNKPLSPAFSGISPYDTLVNSGVGKNYGIEFTLQKYFTNNYYFLITSSLFESKYKPMDGKWYNTKYNLNYVNNFVAGKEIPWGTNKMLSVNTKIIWTGGKRDIPIDLEASKLNGETIYQFDKLYSIKSPDYFRIDLGLRLHFYKKKTEHSISIDIQNLTNRQNTWFQIYDAENQKIINYPMAGLIPIFNYRIEF